MAWSYAIPSALEYFAALVHSDEQLPLLEAVACLGQDEYPDLDVQQVLADVDQLQLQLRLRRRLPADAAALAAPGRQYVLDNYTWPATLDRMEASLEAMP